MIPQPMATTLTNDPVLVRFRKALNEMYGGRLERAVLFGSRARGDARDESDYDVPGDLMAWSAAFMAHLQA